MHDAAGARLASESYIDDQLDGTQTTYFSSGQIHETGRWKLGRKDGAWDAYGPSGGRLTITSYAAGDLDGPYSRWYADGNKAEVGAYEKGDKQGLWTQWDEDGGAVANTIYSHGSTVSEQTSAVPSGVVEVNLTGMPFGGQLLDWWGSQLEQARGKPDQAARYALLRRRVEAMGLTVKEADTKVSVLASPALRDQILQRRRTR